MITDKLINIDFYKNIPILARDFIKNLEPDIDFGRHILSDDIYVNIESYSTKFVSDARFEAHEKYIDIQILLRGNENIFYTPKCDLAPDEPYNEKRDIIFYDENVTGYPYISLDSSNFAVLFPHEAHAPQVAVDNVREDVKKVIIKIKNNI